MSYSDNYDICVRTVSGLCFQDIMHYATQRMSETGSRA